ncbi:hypothetical protein JCM21714_4639 [Gracilibacillus boraciitolerans JCM 21714]|uniref:Uncharacterized protein n=1 Tax=Gracilibacillus boraciitolerans JCM 21714 TaxID=1298598 RepID=W4VQV9_9BACI|nr:hypothetical protein [Gracilibacillus boraciitolerans]GAE95403.1 hypothetical protein JCM21714_4639 [Gracilibacillus boraciitolerans JCM 21714]
MESLPVVASWFVLSRFISDIMARDFFRIKPAAYKNKKMEQEACPLIPLIPTE